MKIVFALLFFYHGEVFLLDGGLHTINICQERLALVEEELVGYPELAAHSLRCAEQPETSETIGV